MDFYELKEAVKKRFTILGTRPTQFEHLGHGNLPFRILNKLTKGLLNELSLWIGDYVLYETMKDSLAQDMYHPRIQQVAFVVKKTTD